MKRQSTTCYPRTQKRRDLMGHGILGTAPVITPWTQGQLRPDAEACWAGKNQLLPQAYVRIPRVPMIGSTWGHLDDAVMGLGGRGKLMIQADRDAPFPPPCSPLDASRPVSQHWIAKRRQGSVRRYFFGTRRTVQLQSSTTASLKNPQTPSRGLQEGVQFDGHRPNTQ